MDRVSLQRTGASVVGWLLVLAVLAAAPLVSAETTQPDTGEKGRLIDINQASVEELIGLPGIGEVTAKRIVEFREQHGPFKRVEDLLKVKGIGEKSFQKLRSSITVSRAESE